MRLFACKHPVASLLAESGEVETTSSDADFLNRQMRFRCLRCNEVVAVKWCNLRGGVEAFLARGEYADSCAHGDPACPVNPVDRDETVHKVSVENLYHMFKARMMRELVVDAPDLRTMGVLVDRP